MRAHLLASCMLLACSADEPVTEVLVAIDSDLASGSELTSLQVKTLDGRGQDSLARSRELTLVRSTGRANAFTLPLSYSLTPGSLGDSARFRIEVTGRGRREDSDEIVDVVRKTVAGAFEPGARMLLPVFLQRSCSGVFCALDGDSCLDGACVPVEDSRLRAAEGGPLGGYRSPRADDRARDGGTMSDASMPAAMEGCRDDADCEAMLGTLEPAGCATGRCESSRCTFSALDADGDGHASAACTSDRVRIELGDDCDDREPRRSPDAWDGPQTAERASSCDELDNDCDGVPDDERPDGKSCTCDPARDVDVPCSLRGDGSTIDWPAGTPLGSCRYGTRSCTSEGAWGECTGAIEPRGEDDCSVPDDDSDCDGLPNEGCPCTAGAEQACGSDVGNCRSGTQTCNGTRWGSCMGQVTPKPRDGCDPDDDADCDGTPNENCACVNGTRSTCREAVGALGACGARSVSCRNGAWDLEACAPTQAESCSDDGVDEDCDGLVNEPPDCECTSGRSVSCLSQGALGTCALGRIPCVDGRLGECDRQPAARDLCTFLSNDDSCNGISNEGCACVDGETEPCSVGACAGGERTCDLQGVWGECTGAVDCPEPDLDAGG